MSWTLALDVLIALLLAGTITTTFLLNRRLAVLRADRDELDKLAQNFLHATQRADDGVAGLKVSALTMQERIEAARTLADDLDFLIERGAGVADRLESTVRTIRRTDGGGKTELRSRPELHDRQASRPDTKARSELHATRAADVKPEARAAAAAFAAKPTAGASAAPTIKPHRQPAPAAARAAAEPRSEAERVLLAAMRAHG